MIKNLKPSSANYKLRTTNYREKGPYDAAIRLRATSYEPLATNNYLWYYK